MSDFIKINFLPATNMEGSLCRSGFEYVTLKKNIRITTYYPIFYAWDITDDKKKGEISKEEYERLCKELEV